ncbi:MAG: hypothetical protein ACI4RU_00940 [Acutalibacteraceae bacterium]
MKKVGSHIFDKFYRGDRLMQHKERLGIGSCKTGADITQGEIGLESVCGQVTLSR